MAEIEFSVLSRSCLRQRIPDQETLGKEVQALVRESNLICCSDTKYPETSLFSYETSVS